MRSLAKGEGVEMKFVSRGKSRAPRWGGDGGGPLRVESHYVGKKGYGIVFNIIYNRNKALFFKLFC